MTRKKHACGRRQQNIFHIKEDHAYVVCGGIKSVVLSCGWGRGMERKSLRPL